MDIDIMLKYPLVCILLCYIFTLMGLMASGDEKVKEIKDRENMSRQELLTNLLSSGYDHRIPPNFERKTEEPTIVKMQLHIYSVDSFNEATMDYSISCFLQQFWVDNRLEWTGTNHKQPLELDAKFMDEMWVPDTFFSNEKSSSFHLVTVPNRMMHLFRNGSILYSVRLSLTLTCQMLLHKYPFDKQTCSIVMESYGHTTESLIFGWYEDMPLEINAELELPQFYLLGKDISDCTKVYGGTNYTCLRADIYLKRKVGFFIIQIYIPSILIVILSWVSFWLNYDATPARISLGVLTILTMTTQSSGARTSLPKVSYIKAIDVWMSVCLVFVFAALVEFALVNVMVRRYVRSHIKAGDEEKAELCDAKNIRENGKLKNTKCKNMKPRRNRMTKWMRDPHGRRKANWMDGLARILFPATFFLFNALYWLIYLLDFFLTDTLGRDHS